MVDAKTGRESSFRTGFSQIAASLTFAPLVISQAYSIWARRLFRGKKRKGFHPKMFETQMPQSLVCSKWTICSNFGQILLWKFSNFFTFILGGQFLLPQRANNGEKGILPTSKVIQRVFSARGIQTGPFASYEATFVSRFFQLFHLHTGRPILITPEGK